MVFKKREKAFFFRKLSIGEPVNVSDFMVKDSEESPVEPGMNSKASDLQEVIRDIKTDLTQITKITSKVSPSDILS